MAGGWWLNHDQEKYLSKAACMSVDVAETGKDSSSALVVYGNTERKELTVKELGENIDKMISNMRPSSVIEENKEFLEKWKKSLDKLVKTPSLQEIEIYPPSPRQYFPTTHVADAMIQAMSIGFSKEPSIFDGMRYTLAGMDTKFELTGAHVIAGQNSINTKNNVNTKNKENMGTNNGVAVLVKDRQEFEFLENLLLAAGCIFNGLGRHEKWSTTRYIEIGAGGIFFSISRSLEMNLYPNTSASKTSFSRAGYVSITFKKFSSLVNYVLKEFDFNWMIRGYDQYSNRNVRSVNLSSLWNLRMCDTDIDIDKDKAKYNKDKAEVSLDTVNKIRMPEYIENFSLAAIVTDTKKNMTTKLLGKLGVQNLKKSTGISIKENRGKIKSRKIKDAK